MVKVPQFLDRNVANDLDRPIPEPDPYAPASQRGVVALTKLASTLSPTDPLLDIAERILSLVYGDMMHMSAGLVELGQTAAARGSATGETANEYAVAAILHSWAKAYIRPPVSETHE